MRKKTDDIIQIVVSEYENGSSIKKLAKKYRMSVSTVSKYIGLYSKSKYSPIEYEFEKMDDQLFTECIEKANNWSELAVLFGISNHKLRSFHNHVWAKCKPLNLTFPKIKRVNSSSKKELFDRRPNWWAAATTIRKAARAKYTNSDKPKKCAICGYDKYYEVCHIKPVSEFDDDTLIEEINNIDNLIALCPNHHWEYDNGLISKEQLNDLFSHR